MHRYFKFLQIRNYLLLFYNPSLKFILSISFVQPRSFRGDFYFSWRGMTLYSASCFGGNFCRLFSQCCMRICVCLRLFHTFVYGLRALCGFFIRIRICFCASCADFACVQGLSSQCSILTVSRDPILKVPQFLLSVRKLVIRGQYQGIQY